MSGQAAGGRWRTPLAILLVAATARGVAAVGLAVIPRDAVVYLSIARAVSAEGAAEAFASPQHPLFPLLAGWAGGGEIAATVLAIAASSLGALPLLSLGTRLHSRGVGVVAALLYAVAPGVLRYGAVPLPEALFLPLLLFSLERGTAAADRKAAGVPGGLFAAAAYLARPEGLLLALTVPVWLAARRRIPAAALFALGFLVLAGPYVLYLSRDAGRVRLSPKKPVGRILIAEEGFDAHMAKKEARTGLVRPGPGEAALDTLRTLGEATSFILLALAIVGVFALARRPETDRSVAALLLGLALLTLVARYRMLLLHGYLGRRHLALVVALLLPFAAAGVLFLARRRSAVVVGLLAAALLVVSVKPRDGEKRTLVQAGRDIRAAAGPGARVATWITPRIAHYAEGTDVPLAEFLPEVRRGGGGPATLLGEIGKRADFLALVPERLDPEVREALIQATRHLPHRDVGAGRWRVRIFRLR